MIDHEELVRRKNELEQQLSDPEIFKHPERVKEVAMELGRIEKELQSKDVQVAARGTGHDTLIMEIRAGAGGDEAALFAGELFTMYGGFAQGRSEERRV